MRFITGDLPQTKTMLNWNEPTTPQKKRNTQKVHMFGENAEPVITAASANVLSVNDNLLPILLEFNYQIIMEGGMQRFDVDRF